MNAKFVSPIAASLLVVLPTIASSAFAGPEVAAYATADSYARQSTPDTCRSARQTAELVRQMQGSDGGLPFPIPAECASGAGARKHGEAVGDGKVRAAELARPQ